MEYKQFVLLPFKKQLDIALEAGEYRGEDYRDRSVYQMPGYWVLITEDAAGKMVSAEVIRERPWTDDDCAPITGADCYVLTVAGQEGQKSYACGLHSDKLHTTPQELKALNVVLEDLPHLDKMKRELKANFPQHTYSIELIPCRQSL